MAWLLATAQGDQRVTLPIGGMGPELRGDEQLPFFDALGTIQLKEAYGGAIGGRGARERPIRGEIEMIIPGVSSGVEQGNYAVGLRIDGRQVAALVSVADGTAEGEILVVC